MGCLYSLSSPSGKRYLGISNDTAEVRWKVHQMRVREGRNNALQQAIRKYGADNFVVTTLVIAADWDYLCDLEKRAIAIFGTLSPRGYNLTSGGEGVVGRIVSDSARQNMSAGQRRRFVDPLERAKSFENGCLGREVVSKKWAALRVRGKARWEIEREQRRLKSQLTPDEFRKEHSARVKASLAVPAVKQKLQRHAAVRAADPNWRRKISDARRGQKIGPMSDECKMKIAAARRREWQDPVIRVKRLKALEKARAAKTAR